ncbi:hypothetical protein LIER_37980 [Lithospermum erythrorhizon]|uniref:Uncharacterized protein n=1 Tax=Lithospermum erythrorhizon TaxID=34254 RepID=A0AAV3PUX5_LITER
MSPRSMVWPLVFLFISYLILFYPTINLAVYLQSNRPVEVSSSLSGGVCTEVVDTGESHAGTAEAILLSPEAALVPNDGTSLGTVSVGEHPVCMAA